MTSTMDTRTRPRIMNDLLETTFTLVQTALSQVDFSLSPPLSLSNAASRRPINVSFLTGNYQNVGMAIGITLTDDPTTSIQRSSTSRLTPSVAPTGTTTTQGSSGTLTITNLNQEYNEAQGVMVSDTLIGTLVNHLTWMGQNQQGTVMTEVDMPNGKVWVKGEDHTLLWVMYDNNHLSPSTVNNQ
ncbi:hypothetical protein M231_04230 [Tremella mesenterica]|uniref:Uncharacterized protein n=1 Tax=Tremella mesenterica TaxID=5217 RepID=A0A4Q1BL14_TREME|nr:hypothetical protein M231_04230 [Tremella mesenterica]